MKLNNAAVVATLLFGLGSLPLSAHASGCSAATIKGTFGFQSTVTQNNDVPPFFLELVGTFQFDGQSHALEKFTYARSDGSVGSDSASISYNVSADCTFTMTQDNGETHAGVIVNDGQEFYFIETSGACCGSSIIRRGYAKRIHPTN